MCWAYSRSATVDSRQLRGYRNVTRNLHTENVKRTSSIIVLPVRNVTVAPLMRDFLRGFSKANSAFNDRFQISVFVITKFRKMGGTEKLVECASIAGCNSGRAAQNRPACQVSK